MIPKTRKEAFKVLGLSESASTEKIKKAYRELALKWHPDKWSDKSQEEQKTATEKFKEISVAYKISIGEITEEFISQQPNDDWVDECMEGIFGSHLNDIEIRLFIVLANGFLKEAELLLPKITNPNIKSQPGNVNIEDKAPLHYIVQNACDKPNGGWEVLLEKFLSSDNDTGTGVAINSMLPQKEFVDVNIGDQTGTTPLHVASKYGRMDLIQVLLKYGADVNKLDELSHSPLYQAASGNHVQTVKLLLEHKAKISNGERVLILGTILYDLAEGKYSAEVTTMLLDRASTEEKNEIFLVSCRIGKVELVSKLLSEYRVNSNLISVDGCATILQDICQSNKPNSVNIANLLLQAGAEQTLVVGKWPSALEIVQQQKNKEFIELFAQYKNKTGSPVQHTNNHFQPTLGPEVQSAQPPITDNKNHHSPQKQPLGGEWTKENNNNSHTKQNTQPLPVIDNKIPNSPQKQASGISPRVIGLALLFGAVGATLVAIGIIPEIVAIGVIATAVLLGIAGAALGGIVGYLTDITVNKCCNSEAVMKVA